MERIAIISPGALPVPAVKGGAVENLITYLLELNEQENKYKIDLYTIYDSKIKNIKYKNTNIISVNKNKISILKSVILNKIYDKFKINKMSSWYAEKVTKILNKSNINYSKIIVENSMVIFGEIYLKYKGFNNTEVYYHMHNTIYDVKRSEFLFKIIGENAKKILAVSEFIKAHFNSVFKTNNINVYVNCVDFKKYNYKLNYEKLNLREKLDIPKYSYNFIFTGRCTEEKGVLELINAYSKLYRENPNISLTICGVKDNEFANEVRKATENLKNIELLGYTTLEKMSKYIATSDSVVIPSKCDEAFGMVTLEAMSMAKCIISSNSGGLAETIDNSCGIIVSRNNLEKELYDAMKKVSLDKALSDELGKKAFEKVHSEDKYNKENYLKELIKIIGK